MSDDSLTLFDVQQEHRTDSNSPIRMRAVARPSDPVTSHEAAASIGDLTLTQRRVLEVLERYGPATDEEINRYYFHLAQVFDWNAVSPSGLRSRRAELVATGKVKDSGERGTTKSGRSTVSWALAGE
ncbi:hypothetical protein UFOVP1608_5 [uncultured Caudovirales phage]|uniref:Uncharacterized protein n=1 Tax=uncultured Caudovirales phage TaxID=2100421 RepID=A0A6J5SUI1_9CAUD|nr:hypothetical protein UFOVP1608_5 [uncultured Caudovirales phage]